MTAPWADAVDLLTQWVNGDSALRQTLGGGATQQRRRSPYKGTYALLTWAGGGTSGLTAEGGTQRVLLGANVNSTAYETAVAAAVALCSALDALEWTQPVVDGWRLLCTEDVTGPQLLTRDSQGAELYVAATVLLQPAT